MGTEDDTFNRLKRTPVEQLWTLILKDGFTTGDMQKLVEQHGWQWDSFIEHGFKREALP